MKTTKYIVSAVVILLTITFLAAMIVLAGAAAMVGTAEAGREQMACTNEPQVGVMVMEFYGADYALQAISFAPVCSGQAAVFVTPWGDYGPEETVTGKALGATVGAVSLQLPDVYTGTANVSWMVVPTAE